MPQHRHHLAPPGHALARVLQPLVTAGLYTAQELHHEFGQGARRTKKHHPRPHFQVATKAAATSRKVQREKRR